MNRPSGTRRGLATLRHWMGSAGGAALGALAYGVWALLVNWPAGPAIAVRSAAVHFTLSALLTYTGTSVMRRCFDAGGASGGGAGSAAAGGLAFTYAVLLPVHWAIGTPEVALTLAPGALANVAFCTGYALLLAAAPRAVRA